MLQRAKSLSKIEGGYEENGGYAIYSLGVLFAPLRLYFQNRCGRRISIRFSCCVLWALIKVAGTGKWINLRFQQLFPSLTMTDDERQIALNLTFIGLLQFLSYDVHAWALMFEDDAVRRQTAIQGSRLLEGLHAMERQRGNPTLEVSTVNKLIQLNYDGGLSYMLMHLTVDAHLMPPSDRVNIVYWALGESGLFAWTVRKCAVIKHKRISVLA
ncbi:hypothetical protein NEUTE1DRAFT_103505 [Neurospora tetrasperma FGSC 2508]|uniref:Uncharacterized protein n=1 Tax=Neurospora tetrasperma (strain FGSC 2508 / ATCC MYA-4615 / P0657) TaxID=510951 RepID=F8MVW4_NEUT8|nr:uncharacterized protein NEUTE1DRAFT_103505 [Neurospora tetrasperma FGSC 2508]EGO54012.1 hypothetical protein NEUTE1DRAFT_103505 [Neurospora tetrasperma FGSC 2508]